MPAFPPAPAFCGSLMSAPFYDTIVVGSGAAGSFAAKQLTDLGQNVLLVEAGPPIGPKDFDPRRKPATRNPISILDRATAMLGGQHVQSRAASFRGAFRQFYVNDRDNPYTTPKDAPFIWIRGRQEGGRMHTFGRVLLRWTDDDFKALTRTGSGVDWPFAYADLAPYYDEIETCLGLYGNADKVQALPDGIYTAPAKLTEAECKFKAAIEDRWPDRHVVAWRSIAPDPARILRPLREAKESGRLTIRYHSVAHKILAAGARVTGIEVVDARTLAQSVFHAGHVVLCASPVESVRLMLNSASDAHPGGIGNGAGLLGRYFMDQLPMLAMGIFPPARGWATVESQPPDPFYDPAGGVFIPRFDANESLATRGEFVFQGSVGRTPTAPGNPAKFSFFGFGKMLPHADNRIKVDPRRKDRWGIPAAHIQCRMQPEDVALLRRQEEAFLDTVNGAGGVVEFLGSPLGMQEWGRGVYPGADAVTRYLFKRFFRKVMVMGAAIHESGGARMGTDPATSVLNGWGQCWDAPNLVVTDASAFAGSGVAGTTLTVMAQTLRACRHLAGGTP